MFSLDFDQDLKKKGRIGKSSNEEFDLELMEICNSVKSIKDLRDIFHLCKRYSFDCRAYVTDNLLILTVIEPKVNVITLEFKTSEDIFSIITDY